MTGDELDAPLILASASPRRRELLAAAGFAFEVAPADLDETRKAGESPHDYVRRLAIEKATAAAERHPRRLALGADTAVVIGDDVLGKPVDAADATRMLRQLSGRAHDVLTGVALACGSNVAAAVGRTVVWMDELSDADIAAYIATGEPMDKAGAYGIQGWAARFIPRIDGSYGTVVGLPMTVVMALLRAWRYSGHCGAGQS